MKCVMQELLLNIKNGFILCDKEEARLLQGKKVLVVASAGEMALEQLMENFLLPANAQISISGTKRCKRYIDENRLSGIQFFYHEGVYAVNSLDYKAIRYLEFDTIVYLATQKDLFSYINIEEICWDYNQEHHAEIYCADMFGNLWKSVNFGKYFISKNAYKSLIDYNDMEYYL